MSIIYDALKKVGESVNLDSQAKIEHKSPPHKYRIYLVFLGVSCAVILGILGLRFFKKAPSEIGQSANIQQETGSVLVTQEQPSITLPPETEIAMATQAQEEPKPPPPSFILNGVFFSEGKGYALVNNQIVKEGDMVQGAVVKRISLEEVELEFEGSPIKLSTGS